MNKPMHYALVLTAVCLAAALGVAGVFAVTHPRIVALAAAGRTEAQTRVMPAPKGELKLNGMVKEAAETDQVYEVSDSTGKLGYAASGEAHGYGGPIIVMVGLDPAAEAIIGLEIVTQSETPGLGTRVNDLPARRTWLGLLRGQPPDDPGKPVPPFLKQFYGLKAGEIQLKQSGGPGKIEAITGATISSRAVTNAVAAAVARIQSAVNGPSGKADSSWTPSATTGATK